MSFALTSFGPFISNIIFLGLEALDFLKKEKKYSDIDFLPDLILLDKRLITMDGDKLLKIIKKDKHLPKIKNLKRINEKIKNVNDSQLKISLSNFLKAYNERNK